MHGVAPNSVFIYHFMVYWPPVQVWYVTGDEAGTVTRNLVGNTQMQTGAGRRLWMRAAEKVLPTKGCEEQWHMRLMVRVLWNSHLSYLVCSSLSVIE